MIPPDGRGPASGDPGAARPILLAFRREELVLVNNALNEVCNGLHFGDSEFHARLGGSRGEARAVLRRVSEALGGDRG